MLKRTLGKTNLSVSVLGFGAAPIAYLDAQRDRSISVMNRLLEAGVNLIDTAASYPGSEDFLGEHFSDRRRDFVLVSKCGQKIEESDSPPWSAQTITATVDRALKRLRTDHLDVMLLHSCKLDVLKKGEAMGALVKARDAGKTTFIGYSGDNEALAFAAGLAEVDVVETSINIVDQNNIDQGLAIARQNNVGVIAKRPIANSAWRDVDKLPGMYKDYAAPYIDRLKQMKVTPESVGFTPSNDSSDSWAEMALRFTLSIDGVHTAIIGTTNPDNAASNVRYASAGPLSQSVVQNIRDVFRNADPEGKWTGQT
jgi:aryl-alcohol dehydrogenase-like predicted oxidoreductase